jgi:hypothetical protein
MELRMEFRPEKIVRLVGFSISTNDSIVLNMGHRGMICATECAFSQERSSCQTLQAE